MLRVLQHVAQCESPGYVTPAAREACLASPSRVGVKKLSAVRGRARSAHIVDSRPHAHYDGRAKAYPLRVTGTSTSPRRRSTCGSTRKSSRLS